jgi:hypothetical protein
LLGICLDAVAAFVLGWLWYSPKIFYKIWTQAAGISHSPEDKMGVAFGLLVLGLILHAVFVGEMLAHGMVGPLLLAIGTLIVMAYSNSAFKKLGNAARLVDAGSWAADDVGAMAGGQRRALSAPFDLTDPVAGGVDAAEDVFVVIGQGGGLKFGGT